MITLQPQSPFVIWWQQDDPLDVATYYVRVVIKNALTSVTLATIDLTDNGDGSHTYTWTTPVDGSGSGLQINMKVLVYTDAGHTTLASNKSIENRDYIVMDRVRFMGGGGGADIDYKRLRKIVQEELEKIPKEEIEKPDFTPIMQYLGRLESKINSLPTEIPENEKVDLSTIHQGLMDVGDMIAKLPAPEKLDLSSVYEKMEMYNPDVFEEKNNKVVGAIQKVFAKDILEIKGLFKELMDKLNSIPMAVTGNVTFPKQREEKQESRARFL
jgi:hypothetical protein